MAGGVAVEPARLLCPTGWSGSVCVHLMTSVICSTVLARQCSGTRGAAQRVRSMRTLTRAADATAVGDAPSAEDAEEALTLTSPGAALALPWGRPSASKPPVMPACCSARQASLQPALR